MSNRAELQRISTFLSEALAESDRKIALAEGDDKASEKELRILMANLVSAFTTTMNWVTAALIKDAATLVPDPEE